MAPKKRTTRALPATTTTTTTPITNAQLKALIDQGVADASAARDADKSRNGDDSYNLGTGIKNQVKFATCTLHSVALTWWNTHVKTVGHDAAYGMPWKTLMKMITDKLCPRNEIKKLEIEIWDLKVKGTDISKITRKPSKRGKHRYENGRVYNSRKQSQEKVNPQSNSQRKVKPWSTKVKTQKDKTSKYPFQSLNFP
ncbi:hypothetical protein Tco_0502815 [Tanacetum coccineum]